MGLLDFFRRKAITGTPGVLETLNARQFSAYPALGGTNLNTERIGSVYVAVQNASYGWIYRYSPSVRRVVDYIARNVAQLGLKVYERVSDDEREHAGDHPAAEALRNPNPQTPGQQFVATIVKDFLIYDNAYALKFRAGNGKLTLAGVPPHLVGLVGRSHFSVESYRIYRMDGTFFDVAPENIIHWRGYNPDDPRKGESYLETLREELAADAASRQATTELHRSGLALPGWIERPIEAPEWTEQGRKRFQEDAANQAKAAKRRIPVFEEGMVYKQGGVTPEDAEMIAGRVWNQDLTASLYGMKHVPPEGEEERKQFYADVLPPITEILAAFLDLHVLVNEYNASDHYFEFNMDEKLMGDDRLKALTSAAGAPPLTRNEARARLNLPAKEGGDELITPLNVTVGGKPSPQVMPVQNPTGPPQDGSHRTEDAPVPAGRSLNGYKEMERYPIDLRPPESKQLLLPRRAAKERRRDEAANDFQDAIRGFLSHMERSLKSKGMDAKAVNDDRWNERLAKELELAARRHVQREGEITAARLASSFDMSQTKNYLRTVSSNKAREIVEALQIALASAASSAEIFKTGRDVAAPRAAMTFATSLNKFATKEAGEQDPNSELRSKTWIVTSSNSDHPEMDGESVPLGETFSNGEDGPPADHPGCQCLLEIDGGGHPPQKALPVQSSPTINMTPHFHIQVPEGLVKSYVDVAPAEFHAGDIHVAPAETTIEKGAIAPNFNVEAAPVPDINIQQGDTHVAPAEVTFAKGAIHNPVTVEAAAPADMTFEAGAFQGGDVNIESAPPNITVEPANVNVVNKGGMTKRTVTFSDGRTAEVDETSETKRKVTFSDGRTAEIEESEDES